MLAVIRLFWGNHHIYPFFLFGGFFVVNFKRLEGKLPSLLIDRSTSKRRGWNSYMTTRYRLGKFKLEKPGRYNELINCVVVDLERLQKEIE